MRRELKFTYDDDIDGDIHKFLEKISSRKKSEVIRRAIRYFDANLDEGQFNIKREKTNNSLTNVESKDDGKQSETLLKIVVFNQ